MIRVKIINAKDKNAKDNSDIDRWKLRQLEIYQKAFDLIKNGKAEEVKVQGGSFRVVVMPDGTLLRRSADVNAEDDSDK